MLVRGFKGYGFLAWIVPIAAFLGLSPLFAIILDGEKAQSRLVVNGWVLFSAGVITFAVAAVADRRSGIDWKALDSWSRRIGDSQHRVHFVPLRVFSVLECLLGLGLLPLYVWKDALR